MKYIKLASIICSYYNGLPSEVKKFAISINYNIECFKPRVLDGKSIVCGDIDFCGWVTINIDMDVLKRVLHNLKTK